MSGEEIHLTDLPSQQAFSIVHNFSSYWLKYGQDKKYYLLYNNNTIYIHQNHSLAEVWTRYVKVLQNTNPSMYARTAIGYSAVQHACKGVAQPMLYKVYSGMH